MNLESLEKLINSELTTKINSSSINHDELKLKIDEEDLHSVILFLKNDSLKKRKLSNNKIVIKKEKSVNSFKNFRKKSKKN